MAQESPSLNAYQLRVLAVLALINFVNFAERGVVPPLVPLLRGEFGASSAQLGLLQVVLQAVLAGCRSALPVFCPPRGAPAVAFFRCVFRSRCARLRGH